jgi:plastocyanin
MVAGASGRTTNAFDPNPMTIARGTSVTWMNNDNTAHTTSSDAGLWASAPLAPGASFSFTFDSPGTYTYHCAIHPNMVGTVTVQ